MKSSEYSILDDMEYMRRIDASNMHATLISFGRQCQEAIEIGTAAHLTSVPPVISNFMICGLGGSAIGGDILRSYLFDELKVPFEVNRGYSLPPYVSPSSLLFILSYSGNTEEILRIFEIGNKRSIPIVCITSGGLLADRALETEKCLIRIPPGYPPRTAVGYLFFTVLIVLSRAGFIGEKDSDMKDTVTFLTEKTEAYHCRVPFGHNAAKALAAQLLDRIPLVYASERFYPVARRWSTQIDENSETLALSNVIPEMNHNEIMGWQGLRVMGDRFTAVFLRDREDQPEVQRRMDITQELLESDGLPYVEVWSEGDSLLTRLFSLICLGDFMSYYVAILRGVDPTPVERIEYLKKRLNEVDG
jgi:glucose/mannose-6-phosphate isomerase